MSTYHPRSTLEPWRIEREKVDDGVTGYAGLPVVIETWYALGLDRVAGAQLKVRKREKTLSDAEWAEILTVLLVAGGRRVEDLEALKKDAGLCRLWPILRKATARSALNYLHRFHEAGVGRGGQGEARIVREGAALQGLGVVNRHLVRGLQRRRPEEEATIDVDASIHESWKREALWTYEGVRGYQPVIAYWAEQGVIVADQFREGNVPAGMGNKEFVASALSSLPEGVKRRCLRGDSALYEQKLLRWLDREGVEFGISADVSPQLRAAMKGIAAEQWRAYVKKTADGREVKTDKQWAEVCFVPDERGAKKGERPFRYIGIRIAKKEGDLFEGCWEHFAVVTNRWGVDGNEVLNWQRQRCGTVEWAHDVLKNDMGARVFPAGDFGANAAWYRLNVLALNLLVAMTRIGLRDYVGARPHTMRMHLLATAARVVSHSRELSVIFSEENRQSREGLADCRDEVSVLGR